MTTIQLTPAQHAILAYAIEHTGGKIEWFPDNIKGGARTKVLEGLFNRALITRDSTLVRAPPLMLSGNHSILPSVCSMA